MEKHKKSEQKLNIGVYLSWEPQYSGERTQVSKKFSRLHRTPCNVGVSIDKVVNLPEIAHRYDDTG